ncbi:MAG: hypothetical protein H6739_35805 [Alphaproteobacteria bacterium]|nr:hypothetical protein [Alphaproteobacteria bacterium]
MSDPRWLVSPAFDLGLLLGPALLAVALGFAVPPHTALPGWGYVALVLAIDVAHVYASLWRTYLDPEERRRRPLLLALTPLAVLVATSALFGASPGWFWTAMAYLAVYHFVRQQMGFQILYRLRAGLPMGTWDARVERWLVYGVTLFPVLWWHVHLPRSFDWFMPGDFLPGLPAGVLAPAALALGALAVAHLGFRLRSGVWTPGRDLWLATTAAVWFGGIVLTDADLAFTLSNVVAHGVPYLALVAWTVHRKWVLTGRGPGRPGWFVGLGAAAFLAPLLGLAFVEEALWDVFVWGDHPGLFGDWGVEAVMTHWLVPVLSVPQVTHYVLDGFIWKMGDANPGLKGWVLGTQPATISRRVQPST